MKKYKCILFLFVLILLPSLGLSQKQKIQSVPSAQSSTFVYSSPRGIYIFCGNTIASSAYPAQDTVGYRIERKRSGEDWMLIQDVSLVSTLEQFRSYIGAARVQAFTAGLKLKNEDELWQKIVTVNKLQELKIPVDRNILMALGLLYLDSTVRKDQVYEYRVSNLLQTGATARQKISSSITFGEKWNIESMHVSNIDQTDSSCSIEWTCPRVKNLPVAFSIFRRMVGQEDFSLLKKSVVSTLKKDSIIFSLYDKNLRRNQRYEYYVIPEDFFENKGLESQTVAVYAVNFTRLELPQYIRAESDSMGIRLKWRSVGKEFLVSTLIYRSIYFDSGYVKIAEVPAIDTMYCDYSAMDMTRYYYRLSNRSYNNIESQKSAIVFGYWKSVAPVATPQNITAKPIKNGVEILWLPNQEKNIAGYYVYRGASKSDSLAVISSLLETTRYVDTSAILRGSIQYRYAVVAVNFSQRKSYFSNIAYARPQIPTNPPAPTSIYARPQPNGIFINWTDPREDEPTVIGYALYRGLQDDKRGELFLLKKWIGDPERTFFFDSTAKRGQQYIYAVSSIDLYMNEGNKSRLIDAMIRVELPIHPMDIRIYKTDDNVKIEWEEIISDDISSFQIYRSEHGKELQKIGTIQFPNHEFTDTTVRKNIDYYYVISSVNHEGIEGEKSKQVHVIP